jgi:hypothetical protein
MPVQDAEQPLKSEPGGRHLSAQEKADLRLQLKQQRREVKVDTP